MLAHDRDDGSKITKDLSEHPAQLTKSSGALLKLMNREPGSFVSSSLIRAAFLDYYVNKGYKEIAGASVVPDSDPTLLFINSGMAALKPYFTGAEQAPASAVCNIQTCIRTNDIESIGDTYHLTLFEMMGNWTFGTLSKPAAISDALSLVQEVFQFTGKRLCATYFGGDPLLPDVQPDQESKEVWQSLGFSETDIYALGVADNFWGPAGEVGPCGPCTELFVDLGEHVGRDPNEAPDSDSGRFIEIWNPGVFMEYDKAADGSLSTLPAKHLDAGAGLERWSMILQNCNSVYEIDTIAPIVDVFTAQGLASDARATRILTDHIRTSAILAAEGVVPSNKREGYVLRRLIRRATTQAFLNDVNIDSFREAVTLAMRSFEHKYGHDVQYLSTAQQVVDQEARGFKKTLARGQKQFEKLLAKQSKASTTFSGVDAFKLKDAHGLPVEVIEMLCAEKNLNLDLDSYEQALTAHREKSKR